MRIKSVYIILENSKFLLEIKSINIDSSNDIIDWSKSRIRIEIIGTD